MKRKEVKVIEVVQEIVKEVNDQPECFNKKCEYCNKDICGKWFENCKFEIIDKE